MSLGTSIFLSTLSIILVILYTKRKGNWGIKQIFRVILAIISFAAISGAFIYWYYTSPKHITELDGVRLGETLRDLEFKYGSLKKANENDYYIEDKQISVILENNTVITIVYYCNEQYDYGSLNGVSCGDSSQDILKKYGRKTNISCFPDSTRRRFSINGYSRAYLLERDRVTTFAIYANDDIDYETGEKCN